MPGRKFNGGDYWYGVGGHENDNEVKGNGNQIDFGGFGYDTRLGRRLNIDPMSGKHPIQSPYSYSSNSPILFTDPDGKEGIIIVNTKDKTILVVATYVVEVGKGGFGGGGFISFERLDDKINNKNYSVSDKNSQYFGYTVNFDFIAALGEYNVAKYAVNEDKLASDKAIIGEHTINNSIRLMPNAVFDQLDKVKEIEKYDKRPVGGLTDKTHQHIALPTRSINHDINRIHEIFHTLYFDKDGSNLVGIGSGYSLPNDNEINELIDDFIKENRVVKKEDTNYEKELKE